MEGAGRGNACHNISVREGETTVQVVRRCASYFYTPPALRLRKLCPAEERAGQITNQQMQILSDLLLMTHLTQAFLPLVRRHFMAFALFAAGHCVLRGMVEGEVNCGPPFDFAQGGLAIKVMGVGR